MNDLARLDAAMRRSDLQSIRDRFGRSLRCFGFEQGGRIVSFGWVTTGPEETGELERRLAIPPGEAYVWDCGTVPDRRRLGLYSALLNRVIRRLHAEAVPRVWIGASRLNAPSTRGIANAGFRHVLDLTYRRLVRLTAVTLRPAPDAPPETIAAARRILLKPGENVIGPFAFGWLQ